MKTDRESNLSKSLGTREIDQEGSECHTRKVQLAFRNWQFTCPNNVVFVDVTFHGHNWLCVDSPCNLAAVVIPLRQSEELFLLRCFITRQISLFKLLQHDLAILQRVIIIINNNNNNKQLLDEVEHDIMNYQNRGLCYLPKPKAEADNTDTRF